LTIDNGEKMVEKERKKEGKNDDIIAVVRIRGVRNIKPKIRHTLHLLGLKKPNNAIIVKNKDHLISMLNIVKDYITYGPIKKETVKELIKLRHHELKKLSNEEKEKKATLLLEEFINGKRDKFHYTFRLHPPRKGYKSVKKPYSIGGSLGKRDEIDSLINRMM